MTLNAVHDEKVSNQIKPNQIYHSSDGSVAQYKNGRNFISLCFHAKDFSVTSDCQFYATSLKKGLCGSVAGAVKWLATCASL
jgi:hypothetical protein